MLPCSFVWGRGNTQQCSGLLLLCAQRSFLVVFCGFMYDARDSTWVGHMKIWKYLNLISLALEFLAYFSWSLFTLFIFYFYFSHPFFLFSLNFETIYKYLLTPHFLTKTLSLLTLAICVDYESFHDLCRTSGYAIYLDISLLWWNENKLENISILTFVLHVANISDLEHTLKWAE